MNQAVLALALIRWMEALKRTYAPRISGRRLDSFLVEGRAKVVFIGPKENRRARRAKGERSDFQEVVAALRAMS